MFKRFESIVSGWLQGLGFSEPDAIIVADYTSFLALVLLSLVTYFIAKKILLQIIHKAAEKSSTNWDDALVDSGFFKVLSYIVPAYILQRFTPIVLAPYPDSVYFIQTALSIYMVFVVLMVVNALLKAAGVIYEDFEMARRKPIKGYLQILKLIVYILGGIFIAAKLFGMDNPWGLMGGLGAFSAVLLLVFKDPLLGFVGGIQLSANNMLSPGDWITVPKYDADGTVIDVALTTVKVQNWDRTISMIPTYALISETFKNWRGMEESGGRRIKRSINIDMKSVKFCTQAMLDKFRKIQFVKDYIDLKEEEIEKYNKENNIDNSVLVNGRRQTNIGIFRAYLAKYLHNHPHVHDDMTFLIRQLQPTDKGIPVEIYVFSKLQEWARYEDLQSDIFDHVMAVIPEFGLRVFQSPTGDDLQKIGLKQD
ncbi:MAG: mechanosensitive ion channel family protein [Bacteroidales bacterium]